jgi:tRNA (guanine-N7-)-methyltransferase
VFAEDIREVLPLLQPAGVLSRVYLHFPDPWWKKRHEKRLVMSERVLVELERLMRVGAEFFVQTDVVDRFEQYRALLNARPSFMPAGDEAGSPALADNPYGARSPREKRAIRDGLPVHRLRFMRTEVPSAANATIGDGLTPFTETEGHSA